MTCIVGLAHEGKVYMGGDSAGVNDSWGMTIRADQKVFTRTETVLERTDEWVFGFTSSFRMGQVLRYATELPIGPADDADIERFLCTRFIDYWRAALAKAGWLATENGREEAGSFLVGYRGMVFEVGSSMQVGCSVDGYAAVGCGDDLALGSMYTSTGDPEQRVLTALRAAEHGSAGVRAPFEILSIGN